MPALRPDHISPTPEEAARINAGILLDPDNPELTEDDFARMRPAREFFPPEVFAAMTDKSKPPVIRIVTDAEDAARQAKRGRGRPPLESTKPCISLRLDEDLLTRLRASGRGWQTRINAVLREAVEAGRL